MAKDKAEYVPPKHITEYHKNIDKAKKLIDTTEHHHRFAYEHAVGNVITDEDGLVNQDWLKKEEFQQEFADHMSDFYLDKALDYFKYKKPGEKLSDEKKLDVFQKDRLVKAYANTSRHELRFLTSQGKENFTYDQFSRLKENRFMQPLRDQLNTAAMGHLTKDHIDDIVKHTGAGDMVEKKLLTVEDAAALLKRHYEDGGVLPKSGLDKIVSEYAVKENFRSGYDIKAKPKKKEDDKEKK